MEPQWTKSISSETICNFFYFFHVLYVVIAILAVVSAISLFFMNVPKPALYPMAFQAVITSVLAGVTALFHYLICSRALLSSGRA